MNVFNRTYLKLILVCVSFTLIFYLFCNMMTNHLLNYNIKLVCDVYYEQISAKIKDDISWLKSLNEYLAKNHIIIEYLNNNSDSIEDNEKKQRAIKKVKDIEQVLTTSSFVDSIKILDLENNTILNKGVKEKNFDITSRPWYNESIFKDDKLKSKVTKRHIDYSTGKDEISIISLIYNDTEKEVNDKPIGISILDIYVDDLLNYINKSFIAGLLETRIHSGNLEEDISRYSNKEYNIYIDETILNNGQYLVFKFDKSSLINSPFSEISLKNMRYTLLIVGIGVAILLFMSIRVCFESALMSIKKLKHLLEKLNYDSHFIENKNEFRQLELLADTLDKSFDNKIKELIYYDNLTGLPNRKMLKNTCEQLIEENKKFALIFIDLNKFKYINDVFGHSVGDEYLIKFGNIIKDIVKDKGMFTRYSGDEFILVYKDYIDNSELLQFYNEKIISTFLKPIKINEELTTEICFSTGVAVYPKDADTFEGLISKSDFMMYVNKKNSRNKSISFFDEKMYEGILYTEKIKSELKQALYNNEFYLNYQPIVDKDNRILKAEALIRWNNKNLGFISPDKFIKYLEETRQIIDVGYWIIDTVCKDIKEIKKQQENIQVSINISPLQLVLKEFIPNIVNIVNKHGVKYDSLCFEITETVLLDNKQYVLENINKIRELGIKIALDDFGTGYSSFNYLRSYKLDFLKIDKSFLINNDKLDFDIINQIKEIAHLLSIEVIMEGVETKEQLDIMKKMKIDYLQGYYFSKPLGLKEFIDIIVE